VYTILLLAILFTIPFEFYFFITDGLTANKYLWFQVGKALGIALGLVVLCARTHTASETEPLQIWRFLELTAIYM
jgi:hypothetical protein